MECNCQAIPTYDAVTGALTVDFDMCGYEPMPRDFIAIYPCDAPTITMDQAWWTSTVCDYAPGFCNPPFQFGYNEGEVYGTSRACSLKSYLRCAAYRVAHHFAFFIYQSTNCTLGFLIRAEIP